MEDIKDINKLLSDLGKKLASHNDVVRVEIEVQLKDSTTTRYDSTEDPEFIQKFSDFFGFIE